MKQKTLFSILGLLVVTASSQPPIAVPQVTVLSELQQRPGNPAVGAGGSVVVTVNQLNRAPALMAGNQMLKSLI